MGGPKIHGMKASQNAVGPAVLAVVCGGEFVACDLFAGAHMSPEFTTINPYKQVPALEDGEVKMGESTAIMRYLARTYKPELLPTEKFAAAKCDWALDVIGGSMYKVHVPVVYPVFGFAAKPEPAEMKKRCDEYVAAMAKFAEVFLANTKYTTGDKLALIEYKAAAYFYSAMVCQEKLKGFKVPERIVKYVNDILAEVPKMKEMFEEGDGAMKVWCASKEAIPTA